MLTQLMRDLNGQADTELLVCKAGHMLELAGGDDADSEGEDAVKITDNALKVVG